MDELAERVNRSLAAHQLVRPGDRLVVAVSGGADSLTLLHILHGLRPAWKLRLHVAHLDHGLRPDSEADAEHVRGFADRLNLPCTIERRDVAAACRREGWSVEDGARRVRHGFLLEAARRADAAAIALAHTADDQAETVLMRLLRGAGLLGLGAIPVRRPLEERWLIRPLLDAWRREVAAYARRHRLAVRDDPMNRDPRFLRSRVRHELLPLIERDYNPNIKNALSHLAEQIRTDYEFLQTQADRRWKRTVKAGQGTKILSVPVAVFLRQPKALQRRLIRRAIEGVKTDPGQLEYRHWLEVERLFLTRPAGTALDLPGGVQLLRQGDAVLIRPVGSSLRQAHPTE